MRVKISYTTELDNIPEECWRLLDGKIHDGFELKEQIEDIYESLGAGEFIDAMVVLERIHKLRLVLSNYDQSLDDVATIMTGWADVRLRAMKDRVTMPDEQKKEEKQPDYSELLSNLRETVSSQVNSKESNNVPAESSSTG